MQLNTANLSTAVLSAACAPTKRALASALAVLVFSGVGLGVSQAQSTVGTAAKPAVTKPQAATPAKAQAQASGPLTSTLEAFIVKKGKDGKDEFGPASSARPGDIIEYRAVYKNVSKEPIKDLQMNLPIPAAGVYVAGSAEPLRAQAALRGKKDYAPMPLMRIVKDEKGKEKKIAVPLAEYGSLRWTTAEIKPGRSFEVKARVEVSQNAAPAAAPAAPATPAKTSRAPAGLNTPYTSDTFDTSNTVASAASGSSGAAFRAILAQAHLAGGTSQ